MWWRGTRACARSSRRRWGFRASRSWSRAQARPRLAVDGGERGGACRRRWRRRRGAALILRASRRCGRICLRWARTSTCCCWCCITLRATAGRWRRWRAIWGAAYAARRAGQVAELAALPVQYADYTLWQHQRSGAESDAESAIARQLAFWTRRLADLPDQLDLPSDRPRPAVASYRGDSVAAAAARPSCTAGCWRWRGRAGRACSWCCRRRLRRC